MGRAATLGKVSAMQDARYFRDQAALCLQMARLMSDPHAAESLRADAAQYAARATELEQRSAAAGPLPRASGATQR